MSVLSESHVVQVVKIVFRKMGDNLFTNDVFE